MVLLAFSKWKNLLPEPKQLVMQSSMQLRKVHSPLLVVVTRLLLLTNLELQTKYPISQLQVVQCSNTSKVRACAR